MSVKIFYNESEVKFIKAHERVTNERKEKIDSFLEVQTLEGQNIYCLESELEFEFRHPTEEQK